MKIPDDTSAQFAQSSPPGWDTLVEVSARLEKSGVVHALGGTGLLHCLGFPVQPRDWDLLTDARRGASCKALAGHEIRMPGPSALYPSNYLLQIRAESTVIELIGSFAIALPDRVIRIPTRVWRYHRGVPLGHPDDWIRAYRAITTLHPGDARGDGAKIAMLQQALDSEQNRDGY